MADEEGFAVQGGERGEGKIGGRKNQDWKLAEEDALLYVCGHAQEAARGRERLSASNGI